jgi:other hect domain ubiquitin protein ligase E3
MKKIHFQKYAGLAYYSIATDGKYLYFYISAINGGMFKVGTGQEGTKAGKVYFEKQIHFPIGTKVDEVKWVYLKGKLYLKTSSRDPWLLEVINPNNFAKEGQIQLSCSALFGQQSLITINNNSPILTDGNNLFYLGSRIKITKGE